MYICMYIYINKYTYMILSTINKTLNNGAWWGIQDNLKEENGRWLCNSTLIFKNKK